MFWKCKDGKVCMDWGGRGLENVLGLRTYLWIRGRKRSRSGLVRGCRRSEHLGNLWAEKVAMKAETRSEDE